MVAVAVVGHRLGQGEDRVGERRRERDLAVRRLTPVLVQEEEETVVVRARGIDGRIRESDPDREHVVGLGAEGR
jgi:hypothetical protein